MAASFSPDKEDGWAAQTQSPPPSPDYWFVTHTQTQRPTEHLPTKLNREAKHKLEYVDHMLRVEKRKEKYAEGEFWDERRLRVRQLAESGWFSRRV